MPENRKTEPDIFLAQSVDIAPRSPLSSAINKENCSIFICHKHDEAPRGKCIAYPFALKRDVSVVFFFPP